MWTNYITMASLWAPCANILAHAGDTQCHGNILALLALYALRQHYVLISQSIDSV